MWRKPAVTALVGVLTLSACGGEDNSAPSAKYDGKEVKEIGCDKSVFDAITAQRVEAGKFHGFLALRKSNTKGCLLVYWARFTPDSDNGTSFIVTVAIGDKKYQQQSEPKNPTVGAWTPVIAARKGDKVTACISSSTYRKCLDTTAV